MAHRSGETRTRPCSDCKLVLAAGCRQKTFLKAAEHGPGLKFLSMDKDKPKVLCPYLFMNLESKYPGVSCSITDKFISKLIRSYRGNTNIYVKPKLLWCNCKYDDEFLADVVILTEGSIAAIDLDSKRDPIGRHEIISKKLLKFLEAHGESIECFHVFYCQSASSRDSLLVLQQKIFIPKDSPNRTTLKLLEIPTEKLIETLKDYSDEEGYAASCIMSLWLYQSYKYQHQMRLEKDTLFGWGFLRLVFRSRKNLQKYKSSYVPPSSTRSGNALSHNQVTTKPKEEGSKTAPDQTIPERLAKAEKETGIIGEKEQHDLNGKLEQRRPMEQTESQPGTSIMSTDSSDAREKKYKASKKTTPVKPKSGNSEVKSLKPKKKKRQQNISILNAPVFKAKGGKGGEARYTVGAREEKWQSKRKTPSPKPEVQDPPSETSQRPPPYNPGYEEQISLLDNSDREQKDQKIQQERQDEKETANASKGGNASVTSLLYQIDKRLRFLTILVCCLGAVSIVTNSIGLYSKQMTFG